MAFLLLIAMAIQIIVGAKSVYWLIKMKLGLQKYLIITTSIILITVSLKLLLFSIYYGEVVGKIGMAFPQILVPLVVFYSAALFSKEKSFQIYNIFRSCMLVSVIYIFSIDSYIMQLLNIKTTY